MNKWWIRKAQSQTQEENNPWIIKDIKKYWIKYVEKFKIRNTITINNRYE